MKKTVFILSRLDMLLVGYTFLRIPILDRLIIATHTSKLIAGLAFGLYSAAGAIAMPVRGGLVDYFENRKPIIISLGLITIAGTFLIITLDGRLGLLLGMTIAGLGSMGVYPVGYVLISDLTRPKYRATAYSLRAIINGLGQGIVAVYSVIIGIHKGIYEAAMAYILSLLIIIFVYAIIGDNIPPSKGRKKPKIKNRLKILRSNELDRYLMYFVLIYAIPRGAIQIRSITYFVEHWGVTETMGSIILGISAIPAFLSFPIVLLLDKLYNEKRLWIRPLSSAISIAIFAYLFTRFYSFEYRRTGEVSNRVDIALALILKKLSVDPYFLYILSYAFLGFLLAGIVGPMKNGILADGNLPEYRGILYSSLSVIDTLSRGIGASITGFLAERYSLQLALETLPLLLRIPAALIMLLTIGPFYRAYNEVNREIEKRLNGSR